MQLCRNNLADSLSGQGKYDEAEKLQREGLAVLKRVLGAEHPDTLTAAGNLAVILLRQGKCDEAEKMQQQGLAVLKGVLGAEHPDTLTAAGNLAESLEKSYLR